LNDLEGNGIVLGSSSEPERLSEYFHMVNRLLPADQRVETVSPETPAREALQLMKERGYSQLPVTQGRTVLGLFSYRAFALEALSTGESGQGLADLPVEEFLEHELLTFARLSDEFRGLIDVLDMKDCVVVSGPNELIGIVTPMDVLRYLYEVANAFVLLEEIELALRALIARALGEKSVFEACLQRVLSHKYGEGAVPSSLEQLTLDDHVALVRDGRTWEYFKPIFGGVRARAGAKLDAARQLRNEIFHFKRPITIRDHQELTRYRDWLLRCVRKVEAMEGSPHA
jgi:CBS domain-containing protein